jgi:guanylate kinase
MIDIINATLYVVAAPSGGGKTSLIKRLVDGLDEIEVSVSHTTRPKRQNEQHGKDYFFVDETQFMNMVNQQEFVEHARVFEYYYGTSVTQIKSKIDNGIDVVLDIDWQGAQQLRNLFNQVVCIFVIPPSIEVLDMRLKQRAQDKANVISARMQKAKQEISHYAEFDYLIINDDFEQAVVELQSIVIANRVSIQNQAAKHEKLLSILLRK